MNQSSQPQRSQEVTDERPAGKAESGTRSDPQPLSTDAPSVIVVSASRIVELSARDSGPTEASSEGARVMRSTTEPTELVVPGIRLGHFQIEKLLGRGGMGEVWRARDLIAERTVVLKMLPPQLMNDPEELVAVKEGFQKIHALHHENICPLYLLGQDRQFGYYIVMKYIDGQTLSVYRRRWGGPQHALSLQETVRLLQPVAQGLDYAHRHKILHCDVKPQNIMIENQDGAVQLVDFGLAAEIRSSVSRVSLASIEHGGTYPYMSPEQWRGEPLDQRSDQYSLAVVAYELLAGHRPFRSTDPAVLRQCTTNEVPAAIVRLDPSTNAAILRGLSKSKADRFATCADFIRHLSHSLDREGPPSQRGRPHLLPAQRDSSSAALGSEASAGVIGELNGGDRGGESSRNDVSAAGFPPQAFSGKARTGLGRSASPMSNSERRSRAEARLAQANRRAAYWLGGLAGTLILSLLLAVVWFARGWAGGVSHVDSVAGAGGKQEGVQLNVVEPTAVQVVQTEPLPVGGNEMPDNSSGAAVASLPPQPSVVQPLAYRWKPDTDYVYGVELDVDLDADRVVTLAGDLTYFVAAMSMSVSMPENPGSSQGTAFLIHEDGYFVTCRHVIENATSIELTVSGRTYPARLIADDPVHDLAVMRVESSELAITPLTLSDSEHVEVGEDVRAVGFPLTSILGDNIKATRGTISGINDDAGVRTFQIDATVNAGNSGGPLMNSQGEVVGIIFAKLVQDGVTGVGFATPVNDLTVFLNQHSVPFRSGKSHEKLEGPQLVKQASAATALVTVRTETGRSHSRPAPVLACEGTLNPRSWRRSGQPVESLDRSPIAQQFVYSSNGHVRSSDGVESSAGEDRLYADFGETSLPNFLGPVTGIVSEIFPVRWQKAWTVMHPVVCSIQAEGTSALPQHLFGGPRFGPARFATPFPVGPARFTHPFAESEPAGQRLPGTIQVDYVLGERQGDLLPIEKTFELKAESTGVDGPRIHVLGSGTIELDLASGIPQSCRWDVNLIENEPNRSKTTPMRLRCKLKDVRAAVARTDRLHVAPEEVIQPGSEVVADSELQLGRKLVCEWAGKWMVVTILSLNDDQTVRIHWDGWGDHWDEDVPRSRLRFLSSSTE